ncbi:caspase family protein [Oceaniglobus trochenteri]|uniref:caspase family protein n=1 Tax=Oceaniglobus trochenteri TaxID=2763260 RepID=UPI001CFFA025|nr:caspase family protein [Oceaniglobus trochenteri]
MKRLLATTAAALLLALPAFARENHALLIGASTYPNLDERFWLKGPANDVDLVRRFLTTNPTIPFDPGNITLLADGVEGGTPPTLAAIREAMDRLTETVQPGDFVYLHFSGHGTQAPAADPSSELDGLDELFLPVDIGPWNDSVGTVENALVDDEIGEMLDRLRGRGADVWVVFDSCHSGTATRGTATDDDVRQRQLAPEALAIPDAAMARAEAAAMESERSRAMPADPRERPEPPLVFPGSAEEGSLVAFFAAQTNETTPEKNMPKGHPDRRSQGVFTFTLFQALAERPGITYRQLAQEVLRKYTTGNLARSTPLFEGDLDAQVFAGEPGDRLAQWPARPTGDTLTLDAGTLHGIEPGMELSVMASPADPTEAATGTVTVTDAGTFRTVTGAPADLPRGAWLRKTSEVVDFSLTVALPRARGEATRALLRAAELIRTENMAGPRLRFVAPGGEADLRLELFEDSDRPDAIWFLPATGLVSEDDLKTIPSVSTRDKTEYQLADVMADNLRAMGKALNLLKIGATAGAGTLNVKAALQSARFDPDREEVIEGTRVALNAASVPRLIPDDVIGLRLENTTEGPVDYNILYVGADYSITFMGNDRMQPGAILQEDFVRITDSAFGRDRMVVVLSPAQPQSPVEDLSFLEQGAVERTRAAPVERSGIAGLLDEAGFGETTRAAVSLRKKKAADAPLPMFLSFEFDTIPAE